MSRTSPECLAAIRRHSKSFALASALLPGGLRQDAAVVYAWCRRADDAIDRSRGPAQRRALLCLRRELADIYAGGAPADPVLAAFREVVRERAIPARYPTELLSGMEMDVRLEAYASLDQLLTYCYRVASTVGLMMCHILGVSHPGALRHAAHLGIAMQLTNICRDVLEDWERGRLYLPAEVLRRHGAPSLAPHAGPLPESAVDACRGALRELLALADRYYTSSDAGLDYLSWRCSLSVHVARRVYSAIGVRIARQNHDVRAPRAIVPLHAKLLACAAAAARLGWQRLTSPSRSFRTVPLDGVTHGPELIAL